MWDSIIGGATVLGIGGLVTKHLHSRINRVEDRCGDHLELVDEKLSTQNREIGEVKAIVERIERTINGN